MDENHLLGPLDSTTLQLLLTQERTHRAELDQEVARLRAGLARQNAVIIRLERRDAERELSEMRTLVAALTDQNLLLRQRVAQLEQENAQLRGVPMNSAPDPVLEFKPAAPQREPKTRKKRDAFHNHGRLKLERATRWETHGAEQCPRCGTALSDGWTVRRVQVTDLPPVAPLEITEHRILRRQCPQCGTRVLPPPVGREARRLGQSPFGPRLTAAIATMRMVERLPIRVIQDRLRRESGLMISVGGIVGQLERMATAGQDVYDQLQQDIRGSPVVHADETGWRENGQHTTVWTTSTSQTVYVHHGRRTNEEIDGILGADFGGTIVADCYAAYDVRPVLPKRTSTRVAVGKASSGSPTMTTLFSTEVQYLPLIVNGGRARPPG